MARHNFAPEIFIAEAPIRENCLANLEKDFECLAPEMLFYLNEQLTCAGLPVGDVCILPKVTDLKYSKDTHAREGKHRH